MQQDTSKNGEDIFKKKLANLTPSPPNADWQKIASQLPGEELDTFIKNNLDEIEPTPNPKIWTNIKRKLPLSLLVRNQLNWLSGVAAVLIIFMIAILFFDKKEITNQVAPTDSKIASTNINDKEIVQKRTSDFVFTINSNHKKETSASEELSLEDEKTLEDFWSSMGENEDFMIDVDEDIIKESLKPLLQLPIENLEAALPNQNKTSKKTSSDFHQK